MAKSRPSTVSLLRRMKTSAVRRLAPKVYQDAVAGVQLYGKALDAQSRGHAAVAERMKQKAGNWAQGQRTIPSSTGQWSGNNSVSRLARGAGQTDVSGALKLDLKRIAPKVAPVVGKLALPIGIAAAGAAAVEKGIEGYKRGGVTGAAVEAIKGALDSATVGMWSAGSAKLREMLVPQGKINAAPMKGAAARKQKAAARAGSMVLVKAHQAVSQQGKLYSVRQHMRRIA